MPHEARLQNAGAQFPEGEQLMGQSAAQTIVSQVSATKNDISNQVSATTSDVGKLTLKDAANVWTSGGYGIVKEGINQVQDPMGMKKEAAYQQQVQQDRADGLINQQKAAQDAQAQSA